ncbi:MAG: DUF1016 family protein [Euryarchaeota archaeon]|nr:DUF1016 family protein [Euryarchaeota archaeon]
MRNSYHPKKATKKEQAITQPEIRNELYRNISDILQTARQNAYHAINFVMVEAYWNIGKLIVEEEQQGKQRADYGTHLIKNLSVKLNADFGKGFSEQSLWNMRLFYLKFPILSALRRELTWTHYKMLLLIENKNALSYYIQEAAQQNWSVRALERQINSLYYERLLTSRNKAPVIEEMQEKTGKLTHQDIGQMDMYVRLFEDKMRTESDNPTIGLLLCTEKDEIIAHYSVLKESKQLFASKYRLILPTEEELKAELEREKRMILEQKGLYEIRRVGNE